MTASIKTGTIMLVIGMLLHWLKWLIFDPKRRRKLIHTIQTQSETIKHQDCAEFEREYDGEKEGR